MSATSETELAEYLGFTPGVGSGVNLGRLLDAAEDHIERLLGFPAFHPEPALDDNGAEIIPDVSPALTQAALMLAAHWYENREAASPDQLREVPFGVEAILNEHRSWTF